MQRALKENSNRNSANSQRTSQRKVSPDSAHDSLAERINNSPMMVAQRKKLDSLFGGAIQRVEDEEPLQGKFETAQRVEDEEPLQGKFETAQRMAGEEPLQGKSEAASSVQLKDEAAKPNASTQLSTGETGLPDNLKSGIESLSGISMDGVRVHYNSSQPAQLNAYAYAQGSDIHVAPGQEKHLPHEAWHVVQQAQGRVQPTMQMKDGVSVNDDNGLEREADVMGARAQGGSGAVSKRYEANVAMAPYKRMAAGKDMTPAQMTLQLDNRRGVNPVTQLQIGAKGKVSGWVCDNVGHVYGKIVEKNNAKKKYRIEWEVTGIAPDEVGFYEDRYGRCSEPSALLREDAEGKRNAARKKKKNMPKQKSRAKNKHEKEQEKSWLAREEQQQLEDALMAEEDERRRGEAEAARNLRVAYGKTRWVTAKGLARSVIPRWGGMQENAKQLWNRLINAKWATTRTEMESGEMYAADNAYATMKEMIDGEWREEVWGILQGEHEARGNIPNVEVWNGLGYNALSSVDAVCYLPRGPDYHLTLSYNAIRPLTMNVSHVINSTPENLYRQLFLTPITALRVHATYEGSEVGNVHLYLGEAEVWGRFDQGAAVWMEQNPVIVSRLGEILTEFEQQTIMGLASMKLGTWAVGESGDRLRAKIASYNSDDN